MSHRQLRRSLGKRVSIHMSRKLFSKKTYFHFKSLTFKMSTLVHCTLLKDKGNRIYSICSYIFRFNVRGVFKFCRVKSKNLFGKKCWK